MNENDTSIVSLFIKRSIITDTSVQNFEFRFESIKIFCAKFD